MFPPSAYRSQDKQNGEGVIGPRDNVFPGPAVALDGPGGASACSRNIIHDITKSTGQISNKFTAVMRFLAETNDLNF